MVIQNKQEVIWKGGIFYNGKIFYIKFYFRFIYCNEYVSCVCLGSVSWYKKAFFKLKNMFNNIPCSAPNCMHIFDNTVKPVLLYASEIGVNSNNDSHFISNLYSRNPLDKLSISMGKYVLGVNKRTTNLAIYGELGRYPLYIDTIIFMIKYWVRLCKNTHHDP
jgi:hypothetical protein